MLTSQRLSEVTVSCRNGGRVGPVHKPIDEGWWWRREPDVRVPGQYWLLD